MRSAAPVYRPDHGHFQFMYLAAFALIVALLAARLAGAARQRFARLA